MEEYFEDWNTNTEEIEPIIEILEQPIKVYIKIDNQNNIVDINSDIFIQDFTNWIYIDEGYGDKYAHAQSQYLDKSLIKDDGSWQYKYVNNKIMEV